MTNPSKKVLGIFAIIMISVAGIYNIRTLPIMAEYGFASTFYYILAALVFFIPSALICAELAAGWPKRGGVYAWVAEAYGAHTGFLAVWLEWVNTVVSFPMNLTFISATVAYVFMPSLAHNKAYMIIMTLSIFWIVTWVNLYGIRISSWVSSFGLILGALLPTALIILLGIIWIISGHNLQINFTWHRFAPPISAHAAALLISVILGYAGMQVAAFHIHEIKNPQRDFPRAVFIAALIIILASVFGSLAIAVVVPNGAISIVTGIMQALTLFLSAYHLQALVPIIAFLIVLGAGSALNTWLIAPVKGLHAATSDGHLPRWLHKTNKHHVPVNILLLQALIATLMTTVFLFMPSVTSSYWLLLSLTAILTFIMDILLFSSVIRLRYTQPHTERAYKIPGGIAGVWCIAGLGMLACVAGIILGFLPPSQLETGNPYYYDAFLIGGIILLSLPAFLLWKGKPEHLRSFKNK